MVNWQTITLPKDLEGLGLFQMRQRNQALLAKLCWRLAMDQEVIWAKMLTTKYLSLNCLTEEGRSLPYSKIWNAFKVGGPVYVKGLKWTVNNGENINFWRDFWLPCGPIRAEEELSVPQCVDPNLDGMTHRISFKLPEKITSLIKATPFSIDPNSKDTLTWAFSKDGFFSLKSTYLLVRGLNPLNLVTPSMA